MSYIPLSRDLDELHPTTRICHSKFIAECKARGIKIITTNTWRSFDHQASLYAKGRTTPGRKVTYAKPGQTPHNYVLDGDIPASLAFDIVPQVKGKLVWGTKGVDYALWEYIGAIAKSCDLVWGGKFRNKDRPHLQLKGSRQLLKQRFPESWK